MDPSKKCSVVNVRSVKMLFMLCYKWLYLSMFRQNVLSVNVANNYTDIYIVVVNYLLGLYQILSS